MRAVITSILPSITPPDLSPGLLVHIQKTCLKVGEQREAEKSPKSKALGDGRAAMFQEATNGSSTETGSLDELHCNLHQFQTLACMVKWEAGNRAKDRSEPLASW